MNEEDDLEPFDDRFLYAQQKAAVVVDKKYATAKAVCEQLLLELEQGGSIWSRWDAVLADYCEAQGKPFAPWRKS